MSNRHFNFVVLGTHGTGLNALCAYMTRFPDIICLPSNSLSVEKMNRLLQQDCPIKGVIIDNSESIHDGRLKHVLDHLSPNPLAIILSRDPINRLKSHVNAYMDRWCKSSTGFYRKPLTDNSPMYHIVAEYSHRKEFGELKQIVVIGLILSLLESSTSVFPPVMYHLVTSACKNVLSYDMNELKPGKLENSLCEIANALGMDGISDVTLSDSLAFTIQNRFPEHIAQLALGSNGVSEKLTPCPIDYADMYLRGAHECVARYSRPFPFNFNVGDFPGDLGLFIEGRSMKPEEKNAWTSLMESCQPQISAYFNNLNIRHINARLLLEKWDVDYEDILSFAKSSDFLKERIHSFIKMQFSIFRSVNQHLLANFNESVSFMEQLARP